jgi:hypothetical protein
MGGAKSNQFDNPQPLLDEEEAREYILTTRLIE